MNRYEITKTAGLGCSENFVGQREELVLNTFVGLQAVKRSAKGRDMRELGSVKTARARELLNQLESPELGIDKIVKMMIGLPFL